jgi:two-component system OmpR family sensor kinase
VVPDTGSLPDTALSAAAPQWRLADGQLGDIAEWRSWSHWVDLAWVLLWLLGLAGIVIFGRWEVVPFHLIWISFALLYSFRIRATRPTLWVLAAMTATTFTAVSLDVSRGAQPAAELTEVPLMAAMVWVMLWHGHRRLATSAEHVRVSEENERLLATQRRFLQDASHQLKTPITIALGHAELLARSLADSQDKRDINVIVGELNRLRKLSERLLLIAASANPDFLVPEHVALDEFTAEVLWRWRPAADRQWQFGRLDEVTVRADRERLGLAVDALLENAVQHTAPGDVIRLSVIRDDRASRAGLVVTDGGSGIAPTELAYIFDRFATGTTTDGRRGTGLGLSLVRAVARGHGGDVQAYSTAGSGSTFAICLPATPANGLAGSRHELIADPCGSLGAR